MNKHPQRTNRTVTGMNNSVIAASGAERPQRRTETARVSWIAARRAAKKPSVREDLAAKRAKVSSCVVSVPDNIRKPPEGVR